MPICAILMLATTSHSRSGPHFFPTHERQASVSCSHWEIIIQKQYLRPNYFEVRSRKSDIRPALISCLFQTSDFRHQTSYMNIALIGYGKMGHAIEEIAIQHGHSIALAVSIENVEDNTIDNIRKADLAIEFTGPESA